MPTIYMTAPGEVSSLAATIIEKHHRHLIEAGVTIAYEFATNDKKAPLMRRGQVLAGKVKKVKQEDRALDMPDAVIILDGDAWPNWPKEKRIAVLDHELEHVKCVEKKKKKGEPDDDGMEGGESPSDPARKWQYEADGRPKIKLADHDWEMGGFDNVVERNKEDAVEIVNVVRVAQEHKVLTQKMFNWG